METFAKVEHTRKKTYLERRLTWNGGLHGDKTYMEKRLIRKVDRLTYKGNLHGEGAFTKIYTKTGNTQRRNLYLT